jgi:hypothetical protein
VYSTFSPRYHQAYWTRIDRIDRGFEMARMEATRSDEGLFEVTTGNLSAFSLLLSPEIAPEGKRIEVRVDDRRVYHGTPEGDVLSFTRKGEKDWTPTQPWQGSAQGPPDHAQASLRSGTLAQYGPHVYVYGTTGDETTTAVLKEGAESLADWGPNVRSRWKVLADTEVTPELMATHNLILVGDAASNALTARVADQLPIRQDGDGTAAGEKRVAGPDAAFRVQVPNPLAPGRLVLLYSADVTTLDELLPRGDGLRIGVAPDYVVVEPGGRIALDGYFRDDYTVVLADD